MPTIRELLEREPKEVDHDLSILFGTHYNHVPEISEMEHGWYVGDVKSDRCEIVTFYRNDWDHRRFQTLYALRLDGKCVMVCQNAGREGNDWARRYVIDADAYKEFVVLFKGLLAERNGTTPDVTSIDDEIFDLYYFYNENVTRSYYRW